MVNLSRQIVEKIDALGCDSFQLGVRVDYPFSEIEQGKLEHVHVVSRDGRVSAPESVLPSPQRGRYSRWNVEGREVVRKDLPKEPRSYVTWIYPYGDTSRSMVAAYQTRLVYPRQRLHGHGDRLLIDSNAAHDGGLARIGFRVDRVFDKASYRDDAEVELAAGLLRENVGQPIPVCADITAAEWTAFREVSWELLPPGLRGPALIVEIQRRLGLHSDDARTDVAEQRLAAVLALNPRDVYTAAGRFDRYVAYVFRDDLVVLENLSYGNAAYVMYDSWRELSRRSRLELLADPSADYTRIVHSGAWINELREAVLMSRRRQFAIQRLNRPRPRRPRR